jgi:hypothetical protein
MMPLPPFMNSTGLIGKILEKIQQAKVPERYTQDFQSTVLGYGSGSARPFIPFLKRLNFLESDGRPTDVYKRFRNADSSGAAMAEAMRAGYRDLFQRNEYAYKLSDDKLKNLVVEITGKEPSDATVRAITGSFKECNQLADFEADPDIKEDTVEPESVKPLERNRSIVTKQDADKALARRNIGFSYTINLNLPETTDVEVFNAIFKALKENLLDEL